MQIGTKKIHWKNRYEIRNKKCRLQTQKLDWKQNKYIGNNRFGSKTFTDMQGYNTMRSKLSIRVFVNDKQAYNFNFYILQDLTQIQVQIAGQIDDLYRNLF